MQVTCFFTSGMSFKRNVGVVIQGPPANRANFKGLKKILKYWIAWYSYIYKEVHTLAFAEISESVVLKHNTEQKKNHTQYIELVIKTITRNCT